MGYFRFRRSIRVLPFLRLNIGRRGISTSIGGRGAHVTYGRTGTRTTIGLPGSGLSYTHVEPQTHGDVPGEAQAPDGPEHRSILGRIVRVVLYGLLAFWLLSVLVIWLIARYWPGP